jgi:hypothetical protein
MRTAFSRMARTMWPATPATSALPQHQGRQGILHGELAEAGFLTRGVALQSRLCVRSGRQLAICVANLMMACGIESKYPFKSASTTQV